MSEIDMQELSLDDLAGYSYESIDELRIQTLPQGVYEWEIGETTMTQESNNDGDTRFKAEIPLTVVECLSVLGRNTDGTAVDRESLAGRKHVEKLYINGLVAATTKANGNIEEAKKSINDAIRRLKTFIKDTGFEPEAGTPITEAVLNMRGHRFRARVKHQADRDDKSTKYARLQLEPAKA